LGGRNSRDVDNMLIITTTTIIIIFMQFNEKLGGWVDGWWDLSIVWPHHRAPHCV